MGNTNTYGNPIQAEISPPTLAEVAQARPPRGSGAPSRTRSHFERILALLIERGPSGVLSSELYDQPHLFGRSPRNRISELRKDGHLIQTVPAGASVVRYVLTHENPSPTPRPSPPRSWSDVVRERDRKIAESETAPVLVLTP
ncbi:MAG TPA: hypothetical protein VNH65_03205 [Candidatus Acidoferrum sp.]|nr:hypothetical protein [Candidatus Acidoferrum sp.]